MPTARPAGSQLGAKHNSPGVEPRTQPFDKRYERITTYLEKPLFAQVHELHRTGRIGKISKLMNVAVREYLDRHYST